MDKIAQKVLYRYVIGTSHLSLSHLFQASSAHAKGALDTLERSIQQAKHLIDDSEKQEHIYAEAGTIISDVQRSLQVLRENIDLISYASLKIEEKRVRSKIDSTTRKEIESKIKKDMIP